MFQDKALFTFEINDENFNINDFNLTRKTRREYCRKVNASMFINFGYVFMDTLMAFNPEFPYAPDFEKLCIPLVFKENPWVDRLLYIDADILITPHAKNIFDELDPDYVWMLDETGMGASHVELPIISEKLGYPCNNYYNGGIILMSRKHLFMFDYDLKEVFRSNFHVQAFVSYLICKNKVPIKNIPREFNYMAHSKPDPNNERLTASFIHFAGNSFTNGISKKSTIERDYLTLYGGTE